MDAENHHHGGVVVQAMSVALADDEVHASVAGAQALPAQSQGTDPIFFASGEK